MCTRVCRDLTKATKGHLPIAETCPFYFCPAPLFYCITHLACFGLEMLHGVLKNLVYFNTSSLKYNPLSFKHLLAKDPALCVCVCVCVCMCVCACVCVCMCVCVCVHMPMRMHVRVCALMHYNKLCVFCAS